MLYAVDDGAWLLGSDREVKQFYEDLFLLSPVIKQFGK